MPDTLRRVRALRAVRALRSAALIAALAVFGAATTACRMMEPAMPFPTDPDAPPPIPPFVDAAHLHFTRSQVQVGDVAPDFTLPRTDGSGDLTLSGIRGRPVVLVFGSFT